MGSIPFKQSKEIGICKYDKTKKVIYFVQKHKIFGVEQEITRTCDDHLTCSNHNCEYNQE